MFEVLTIRSSFDSEADFLQRHSPMVVRPQHVETCFLQGAEQAPLTGRFVVVTFPIVLAVPHGLVLEEFLRLLQNAQVVIGGRLVSLLATPHTTCRDESESERPFHSSHFFPRRA